MNELKKLLICGLGFSVAMAVAACDVEEGEECDGGACEAAGGSDGAGGGGEGGGGAPSATYNYVIIVDTSSEVNADGTPGADIGEVTVTCAGAEVNGSVDPASNSGESPDCDGDNGDNCICPGNGFMEDVCGSGKDRGNLALTIDGTTSADDGENYASLGEGGQLVLVFADDLAGCNIVVDEKVGGDAESYEVWVCAGADPAGDCVGGAPIFSADMGGGASGDVPGGSEG